MASDKATSNSASADGLFEDMNSLAIPEPNDKRKDHGFGVPSLFNLAIKSAIQNIDYIEDFGHTPQSIVKKLIPHIKRSQQLAKLEQKTPELKELTQDRWFHFIKRDAPLVLRRLCAQKASEDGKPQSEEIFRPIASRKLYTTMVKRQRNEEELMLENLSMQASPKRAAVKMVKYEGKKRKVVDTRTSQMKAVHQVASAARGQHYVPGSERTPAQWRHLHNNKYIRPEEIARIAAGPAVFDDTPAGIRGKAVYDDIMKKADERKVVYHERCGLEVPTRNRFGSKAQTSPVTRDAPPQSPLTEGEDKMWGPYTVPTSRRPSVPSAGADSALLARIATGRAGQNGSTRVVKKSGTTGAQSPVSPAAPLLSKPQESTAVNGARVTRPRANSMASSTSTKSSVSSFLVSPASNTAAKPNIVRVKRKAFDASVVLPRQRAKID